MSDQIDELAAALAKAQGEMQNAPLNKQNPHFKSKYADLAAIRDATIPALSANGLAITQTTRIADGGLVLVTTLRHVSGQMVESEWPITISKPQEMGSALTYGKRYSWAAMCGISAEDDDDGNEAQKADAPRVRKPREVVHASREMDEQFAATVGPVDPQAPMYFIEPPASNATDADWTDWCVKVDQRIKVANSGSMLKAIVRDNKPALERCPEAKRALLKAAVDARLDILRKEREAA